MTERLKNSEEKLDKDRDQPQGKPMARVNPLVREPDLRVTLRETGREVSLEDIPLPEGPAPRYRRSEYNGILFELNPHSAFEDVPLPNRTLGSDQELEFARPEGQEDHDSEAEEPANLSYNGSTSDRLIINTSDDQTMASDQTRGSSLLDDTTIEVDPRDLLEDQSQMDGHRPEERESGASDEDCSGVIVIDDSDYEIEPQPCIEGEVRETDDDWNVEDYDMFDIEEPESIIDDGTMKIHIRRDENGNIDPIKVKKHNPRGNKPVEGQVGYQVNPFFRTPGRRMGDNHGKRFGSYDAKVTMLYEIPYAEDHHVRTVQGIVLSINKDFNMVLEPEDPRSGPLEEVLGELFKLEEASGKICPQIYKRRIEDLMNGEGINTRGRPYTRLRALEAKAAKEEQFRRYGITSTDDLRKFIDIKKGLKTPNKETPSTSGTLSTPSTGAKSWESAAFPKFKANKKRRKRKIVPGPEDFPSDDTYATAEEPVDLEGTMDLMWSLDQEAADDQDQESGASVAKKAKKNGQENEQHKAGTPGQPCNCGCGMILPEQEQEEPSPVNKMTKEDWEKDPPRGSKTDNPKKIKKSGTPPDQK